MSDDELLEYYYKLDEEIAKCEKRSAESSVGVATGIGSGSIFGIGIGIPVNTSDCNSDELRERRVEVRLMLKKRGLNP